jgi:hypothetical protein
MTGNPVCFQSYAAARAQTQAKLPDSPDLLARYHQAADGLLAMLAERVEPDWEEAEAALVEVDQLLGLQAAIVARVAKRPGTNLRDVLAKLTLWSAAREGCEENGGPEDALVLSALRDLQKLLAA